MSDKKNDIKETTSDTFYSTFIGELVEVITLFKIDNDEAIGNMTSFLLDADNDYFYFGETSQEVDNAVKRDAVYSIRIVKKLDWKEELLKTVEIPDEETEYN